MHDNPLYVSLPEISQGSVIHGLLVLLPDVLLYLSIFLPDLSLLRIIYQRHSRCPQRPLEGIGRNSSSSFLAKGDRWPSVQAWTLSFIHLQGGMNYTWLGGATLTAALPSEELPVLPLESTTATIAPPYWPQQAETAQVEEVPNELKCRVSSVSAYLELTYVVLQRLFDIAHKNCPGLKLAQGQGDWWQCKAHRQRGPIQLALPIWINANLG